jgi:hypothetical protein
MAESRPLDALDALMRTHKTASENTDVILLTIRHHLATSLSLRLAFALYDRWKL